MEQSAEVPNNEKMDFSQALTDEHKAEMEKHANYNPTSIGEHYDNMSANYEAIYLRAGWGDPKKCAEHVILN